VVERSGAGIAKLLLEAGAVTFRPDEPFRFNSGLLSPMFIDSSILVSKPAERKEIAQALEALLVARYRRFDVIAAKAADGIPWGAWVSARFNVPLVYVYERSKRYGQRNQIEGVLPLDARTVVVTDLVAAGDSAAGIVGALRRAGSTPLGVIAIYTYGMDYANQALQKAGVPCHALTDLQTLVDVAERQGRLTAKSHEKVLRWAADPTGWGKMMGFE